MGFRSPSSLDEQKVHTSVKAPDISSVYSYLTLTVTPSTFITENTE